MTSDSFRVSSWFLATTLAERLAVRRIAPVQSEAEPDRSRAAARLKRWRSQIPFRAGDYFQRRLAADRLTEEELLDLLSESAEAVAAYSGQPTWYADLEQVFAGRDSWPAAELPTAWAGADNIGFLDVIAPLLTRGRQRVREGVRALAEKYPEAAFDPEVTEEILLGGLPGQLRRMLARTLVLELNVARLRGDLLGATPEERFASFVQRLRRADTALPFLQEYPVLVRQASLCIDRWVAFSLEFLGHLGADREALRELLPAGDPGPLSGVEGTAGDTHRGGRTVLIARFQSGARVVYKPKALAVDRHFQELLTWINEHVEGMPPFPTLRVLDRETYGWVEYIEARGCTSEAEVRRFYRRQGGYLALLYALEATDFHSENLIAAGENPVLLDLEALFHPRVETVESSRGHEGASRTLDYSVLRVGLLPRRIWSSEGSDGVDVSGLGGTGGQLSAFRVPLLEGSGTDAMHLVRRRIETSRDRNRPTLGEADTDLAASTEDIVAGFEAVYRLFQTHREALLAPGGPVAAFHDDEVRVIIRETKTYTILLYESYHPDVLRDALDRDRLFDRLWVGISGHPYLGRVIPAERAEMLQGDIPMFTTQAGSHDLWTGTGERLPDFFAMSGEELVAQRLRGFGEEDLARQRWIIEASLATTARGDQTPHAIGPPAVPAGRDALLAAAVAVGDRLEALALRGERGASWLGLNAVGQKQWSLMPLGTDLYNGLPGVALFLAYLGHLTGESRYTTLAQAATTTLQQSGPVGEVVGSIGGWDGWGGVIYTMTHLATLWERSSLLAGAKMIAGGLSAAIDRDESLDIVSGAAGCLVGLLALHRTSPSEAVLAMAIRCGERLLARAQPAAQGVSWPPAIPARAPLTGLAHGAAGMALALLELAGVTGDERLRQAAEQAMQYERSLFSPVAGNWPDFRNTADAGAADSAIPVAYGLSWGHGAPGIGLARLQALRHLKDPALRGEIDAALRTTVASGFGRNHSLGSGDLGNLDLLAQAGEILGDPHWQAETARLAGGILESIRRDGWRCSPPRAVETPGLMTGLAGIGLGLLRLAEPSRVPSVLIFAPPPGV